MGTFTLYLSFILILFFACPFSFIIHYFTSLHIFLDYHHFHWNGCSLILLSRDSQATSTFISYGVFFSLPQSFLTNHISWIGALSVKFCLLQQLSKKRKHLVALSYVCNTVVIWYSKYREVMITADTCWLAVGNITKSKQAQSHLCTTI